MQQNNFERMIHFTIDSVNISEPFFAEHTFRIRCLTSLFRILMRSFRGIPFNLDQNKRGPREGKQKVLTSRFILWFVQRYLSSNEREPEKIQASTFITNSHKLPASSELDISTGQALHRYRRGHGFQSRSSLDFFISFVTALIFI